ncbi:hypothetical protein IHE45_06G012800 [Dioscorea alata]|uniref:Uncharacterized protein n=1 Tax=Dioscorea alata TaxID=55571 RepID=A0ACB7VVH1_DIOAL|nr:hypothetical protein IHE45_06G012800 [Dioscorea alata]
MSMNRRSVFGMAERQHYSDYGFDPQLGFFQILEEAMERGNKLGLQSPDALQFKLQKPMTTAEEEQEDIPGAKKKKKKKLGWWRWGLPSPLFFWKKNNGKHNNKNNDNYEKRSPYYCSSSPSYFRSAMSGPLQMDSSAPACKQRCNRSCSGPLGRRRHRPSSLVQ